LFGAAKVVAIGTLGFGIAWWRACRRCREHEAERPDAASSDAPVERLEHGVEYLPISRASHSLVAPSTQCR
jgi:hypothetical protein